MHVMAVSTVTDKDEYWNSVKKAYGRLSQGANWT